MDALLRGESKVADDVGRRDSQSEGGLEGILVASGVGQLSLWLPTPSIPVALFGGAAVALHKTGKHVPETPPRALWNGDGSPEIGPHLQRISPR